MVNLFHDIKRGKVDNFNVVIETPKNSRVKYEVSKEYGILEMDKILYSSSYFPFNYGFIPQTYWEDEDPIDVLVILDEILTPSCIVKCIPIGVLNIKNHKNQDNSKIIAVPINDIFTSDITNINQINKHKLNEIKEFFSTYKNLQKTKINVFDFSDEKLAKEMIQKSFDLYDKKFENISKMNNK